MSTKRRVDIGVASYRNPEKLRKTLESIEAMSWCDWRCFIVHNKSDDEEGIAAARISNHASQLNDRFKFYPQPNTGYAGAVNRLFELAETPYVLYLDNDVEILTPGWDERFCQLLDAHPEVGQVFPGEGHYGFHNGRYHECLWNAGYCWGARREEMIIAGRRNHEIVRRGHEDAANHRRVGEDYGPMDMGLGHHEEVDLMIRLRLAGYQIACDPAVKVLHHESSTQNPASEQRIHAGVVRFMNKWNRYFCGDVLKYPDPEMGPWVGEEKREHYDPRFLRYTDWPPCALYLERWTLAQFPDWNAAPETVQTSAGPMDAIKILKPKGCYIGRAI